MPKKVQKKSKKAQKSTKLGRPTKYSKKLIPVVEALVDDSVKAKEIPTVEGLAYELNIHKDTIYEWMKKHKSFSDAIKKLLAKQATMLQTLGLSGTYNATMAIFLLKNNHDFKDKKDVDVTSDGERIEGINYIVPSED